MSDASLSPDADHLDDLLSEEAIDHPRKYYARLRQTAPVYWNKRWNGWIISGYEEVVAAFRNHTQLSSDRFAGPFGQEMSRASTQYEQLFEFLSKFFVWKDQQYHTRVRALVNRAFTPGSVEKLRVRISELVDELIDSMRGEAEVDFFYRFAFILPVIVIAEFLGVPSHARNSVRDWSEDLGAVIFVRGGAADRLEKAEIAMNSLVGLLRPIVAQRRSAPQDDLLSAMIKAVESDDFLSDDEIIAKPSCTSRSTNESLSALSEHASNIIGAEVDPGLCAGSTICLQMAPGGFARDQRRQAVFSPDGTWTAAELTEAAEQCPMAAIKLIRQPIQP